MSESSGPRATVDTNLFVSGTIFKRGNPFALLEAWRAGAFVLLLSDPQHAELTSVFRRPRIVRRYLLTAAELSDLFARLGAAVRVATSPPLPLPVRDPNDEHILAAALGGEADYLVTGDDDLLSLAGDPRLGALKIMTVVEFLAVLADQERKGRT